MVNAGEGFVRMGVVSVPMSYRVEFLCSSCWKLSLVGLVERFVKEGVDHLQMTN